MEDEESLYISNTAGEIYLNREHLGALERAKVYSEHISLLFLELDRKTQALALLNKKLKASNQNDSAHLAMCEILDVLNTYGYNSSPRATAR